jgi:hypothetical protein
VKQSTRQEPLNDVPAAEPVRAVARSPRTPDVPAPARTAPAPAGGNAAIQRMVTGAAPHPATIGLLAAGGSRALHRLHSRTAAVQPKLTVSQPGDPFEVQAEAVAAQVGFGEARAGGTVGTVFSVVRSPPAAPVGRRSAAGGAPRILQLKESSSNGSSLAPYVRRRPGRQRRPLDLRRRPSAAAGRSCPPVGGGSYPVRVEHKVSPCTERQHDTPEVDNP